MNTLLMLVVLSAGQVSANSQTWYDDYGVALKQAKKIGKPLLIIIDQPGNAAARVEQISHREDNPHERLLASYVLCRVDASTKYGQEVAKAFRTSRLPYTAVIDKTTTAILYTKTGQFSGEEWTATLARYQAGERPVAYQLPMMEYRQPVFCSR